MSSKPPSDGEEQSSTEPKFGTEEWVAWKRGEENLARAHELRETLLQGFRGSSELASLPDEVMDRVIAIQFEEIVALERGEPVEHDDPGERPIREKLRSVVEAMPSWQRHQVWLQIEPLLSTLPSGEGIIFGAPSSSGAGDTVEPQPERSTGASERNQVDTPQQTQTFGANALPDDFDRAMVQLEAGHRSASGGLLEGFKDNWKAGGRITTMPWDELEDLPEKDLEDTEYWSLTPEEIAAGSREWRSLVNKMSPKPSKPNRYELTKLFGSTSRAKVFVEWVRASTNKSHTDAMRWNRCVACGEDIAFLGLQHGDVGCHICGAANDTTIYGDETLSPHMTFARITHINGMQASSFGGRSREMPDFTITRGEP